MAQPGGDSDAPLGQPGREDMEFSIRVAREEDAASIVALLNPIIQAGTYTIMNELCSMQDQVDFIRAFPERGVFNAAVCEQSGQVLGIQDVQPISIDTGALDQVGQISTFVRLDAHRQGIGRALSQTTLEQAKRLGFGKLTAAIRADNPRALAFYQSQGFTVIGMVPSGAGAGGHSVDRILTERLINRDQGCG